MFKSLLTNHPLVNILFAVVLVMGGLSFLQMPREQDPEINFYWVLVETVLPGHGPSRRRHPECPGYPLGNQQHAGKLVEHPDPLPGSFRNPV